MGRGRRVPSSERKRRQRERALVEENRREFRGYELRAAAVSAEDSEAELDDPFVEQLCEMRTKTGASE